MLIECGTMEFAGKRILIFWGISGLRHQLNSKHQILFWPSQFIGLIDYIYAGYVYTMHVNKTDTYPLSA